MLLLDLNLECLGLDVEVGVDEDLYIVDIDYTSSLEYSMFMILEDSFNNSIKVKFPIDFNMDDVNYSVGNLISVKGTVRLDTEEWFYLIADEVLEYGICDDKFVPDDANEDIVVDSGIQRSDYRVKQWREAVIKRDKVCRCCGGHKHLEAHHIFSWKDYPDMRINVDNGVALCSWCHSKYNSYMGHKGTGIGIIDFLDMFKYPPSTK